MAETRLVHIMASIDPAWLFLQKPDYVGSGLHIGFRAIESFRLPSSSISASVRRRASATSFPTPGSRSPNRRFRR